MAVTTSRARRPVRVLQVVGALNRGGVETWLLNALRHIDRDRFQVDVLVHTPEGGAYEREVSSLGARIICVPWNTRPWTYPRDFLRAVRRYGPYDVIHTNMYLFDALPLTLATVAGIEGRVAHIHPLADVKAGSPLRRAYRAVAGKVIARQARVILGASSSSLQAFTDRHGVDDRETAVLYCGLDLRRFSIPVNRDEVRKRYGLPLNAPVIVYVARFAHHKNHEQLVRVADRLAGAGSDSHFVMVGSHGPLLDRYVTLAAQRRNLTVLCGVADVADVLGAADLFFFPSIEEGLGLAAVEAQAAGLPVVATALPTIREATAPSMHELMFGANDDEQALRQIRRVMEDPEMRSRLSAAGRAWAQQFTIETCLERLLPLYERLARSRE